MNLNQNQETAILSKSNRIVCIAGPGSGKTETLVRRINRVIQDGVDPKRIACVTFTNAAAGAILERTSENLGYCGTVHGFMLRLLKDHGKLIGVVNPTVMDADEAHEMLETIAKEHRAKVGKGELMLQASRGPVGGAGAAPISWVVKDFYARMKSENRFSFDALLWFGHELAFELIGRVPVYEHLLWDEGQDSNEIEFKILEGLNIPNCFVVGDPDQSLYAFRGAGPERLLSLTKTWEQIVLDDCYRCDKFISGAANLLIGHNKKRVDKWIVPTSTEPGVVRLYEHTTALDEQTAIINAIRNTQGAKPDSTIAVLVRTNALVSQFTKAFEQAGIAVQRIADVEKPADWNRCKALLALLASPFNDSAAYRYLVLGMGKPAADAIKLKALEAFKSINELCWNFPAGIEIQRELVLVLGRENISAESCEIVLNTLSKLHPSASIGDLLATVSNEFEALKTVTGGTVGTVWVSTIHGAKGREWDVVFLPAFEQGVMPMTRAGTDIEEERRIAFVAITRARHAVIVSHVKQRTPPWGKTPVECQPSQFVKEMGL